MAWSGLEPLSPTKISREKLQTTWENSGTQARLRKFFSTILYCVAWVCYCYFLFWKRLFYNNYSTLNAHAHAVTSLVFANLSRCFYTCQLFLRYKGKIFYPGSAGIFEDDTIISEDSRRSPKSSEVCQRRACSQCFSLQKSEIARKVLSFIHFTHGFRSLHGSELTYFWKLCQARRQQLTFFNQAWEIGPQAWAGVRVGRYVLSKTRSVARSIDTTSDHFLA